MSENRRLDELYRRATAGGGAIDVDAVARSAAGGTPDASTLAASSDAALAWRIAHDLGPAARELACALGAESATTRQVVVPFRARVPRWTWAAAAGAAMAAGLAMVAVYRPLATHAPDPTTIAGDAAPMAAPSGDRILADSSFEGDEVPSPNDGRKTGDAILFNDDFGS